MLFADTQSPRRRLHSVNDVCIDARISRATVWRLIKSGTLKTVSIGRRTLVCDHDRNRMAGEAAGQAFRRILISDLADDERIEANDRLVRKREIGLRCVRL